MHWGNPLVLSCPVGKAWFKERSGSESRTVSLFKISSKTVCRLDSRIYSNFGVTWIYFTTAKEIPMFKLQGFLNY
jgi:hypothetical protein